MDKANVNSGPNNSKPLFVVANSKTHEIITPEITPNCVVGNCTYVAQDHHEIWLNIKLVSDECDISCQTGYTFMAWVKPTVWRFVHFTIFHSNMIRLHLIKAGDNYEQLGVHLTCYIYFNSTVNAQSVLVEPIPINPYNWTHIAVVCPPEPKGKSKFKVKVFVQGKRYFVEFIEKKKQDIKDIIPLPPDVSYNAVLLVGSSAPGAGYIDEVYVWHRRIPGTMVKYLYEQQKNN